MPHTTPTLGRDLENDARRRGFARIDWADLSRLILFVALIVGSVPLAAVGVALAIPLLRGKGTMASHAALATAFIAVRILERLDFLGEPLLGKIADAGLVVVHPSILLPSSAFVIPLLALSGRVNLLSPLTATGIVAIGLAAAAQWMGVVRTEASTAGFVVLAGALAQVAISGWALWRKRRAPMTRAQGWAMAVIALGGLASAGLPLSQSGLPSRVTIWWPAVSIPAFQSSQDGFGWAHIGQLGDLPNLLTRAGYQVSRAESLETVRDPIVVLPIPFRTLRRTEIDQLRKTVASGSSLLLIADHTNIDEVQDEFNSVLSGTGVGLKFDTTNSLFGDGTFFLSGALVDRNKYLTHNRGASLLVSSPQVQVLLRGSFWHSDLGDRLAPDRAFLSDYRISPGDRIGNIILAARVPLGQGQVLVWGDGSPFLNQNLAYNSRFIIDLFQQLSPQRSAHWGRSIFWAVVAGIFLLFLVWRRAPEVPWVVLLSGLLWMMYPVPAATLPPPIALISDHENNGFDRDAFAANGITGLGVWASRNGYTPWVGDWTDKAISPELLFVINPNLMVTRSYVRRLSALIESGTTVVVSGGGDNPAFRAICLAFGAEPTGQPLGRVKGPDFVAYSAWRLNSSYGEKVGSAESIIGVVQHRGAGRLVLLADSGFFNSSNIESETSFNLDNQKFIRRLVESR